MNKENKCRIASCKICGKNMTKLNLDKTQSGFIGQVDPETGKRWMARVCPECTPKIRKERYRPKIKLPDKIICAGCGCEYQPKQRRTTVCSNKCRNRLTRRKSAEEQKKTNTTKIEFKEE